MEPASRVPASRNDQANAIALTSWEGVAPQAIAALREKHPQNAPLLAFLNQNHHIILSNKGLELKSKWNEKCKESEGVTYSVEGKSPLTGKQASRHPVSVGLPIAESLIMEHFHGRIKPTGYQRLKNKRNQAVLERDQALNERNQARRERDQANGERDQANGERDQARRERDQANGERDQARHERDQANGERDQANKTIAALRHDNNLLKRQLAAAEKPLPTLDLDEDNADGEPNDRHADVTDRNAGRSQSATDEEQHQEDDSFLLGGASSNSTASTTTVPS